MEYGIRHDGKPVVLQPQPARVLAYLMASGGRVVSRDELIKHVWPDGHHVDFKNGLNYCIRQIRIALDDDVEAPRYLQTLPRKGYRWIARPAPAHRMAPSWTAGLATALSSAAASAALLLTLFPGPRPLAFHVVFNELHRFSHVVIDPYFQNLFRGWTY